MRKDKILGRIEEIKKRNNSANKDSSLPPNPALVTPEKPRRKSSEHSGEHKEEELEHEHKDSSDEEVTEPEYTKQDLEQLKGILHKDIINKDDKNSLPIAKYTEQQHDTLKMLVGWEGKHMKRFLQIKHSIKNFKVHHGDTFQEIGATSLANMAAKMKGCNDRKNQRLTHYAK